VKNDPTAIDTSATTEESRRAVVELARLDPRVREGDLEIDDNAVVSWGCDNGAYVQAWLWLSFEGTALDEDAEESDGETHDAARRETL